MKVVTAIVAQQKNKKRVNLHLDGEYFCSLDLFTVMSERLKVGDRVDEKRLKEIGEKAEFSEALEKALGYISKGAHTKAQMIRYLKNKEYANTTIAKVIDKLVGYGYVDDEAFARKYYLEKRSSYGQRKIRYDLKLKGVDEKTLDKVFDQEADGDDDACISVARKYLKGRSPDRELKVKCYRYLLGKGFDYDRAKSAVEKLEDEDNNT